SSLRDFQRSAIAEPKYMSDAARVLRHHELYRESISACAIARPMGEVECRDTHVAVEVDMGAGVGEAGHRKRITDHRAARLEIAVGVVEPKLDCDRCSAILKQVVVEILEHIPSVYRRERDH